MKIQILKVPKWHKDIVRHRAERAKAAFEALSPEEKVAVMQQAAQEQAVQQQAMQEQAVAIGENPEEQEIPVDTRETAAMIPEQAVMEQPEVISEGEPLNTGMAEGGKLFADGGSFKEKVFRMLNLKNDKEWEDWAKKYYTSKEPDKDNGWNWENIYNQIYDILSTNQTRLEDMPEWVTEAQKNAVTNGYISGPGIRPTRVEVPNLPEKNYDVNLGSIPDVVIKPEALDLQPVPHISMEPRVTIQDPAAPLPQQALDVAEIVPPTEPKYPRPTVEAKSRQLPPNWMVPKEVSDEPEPSKPVVVKNPPIRRRAEWPRYAGIFAPAINLGLMGLGVGKPDYSGLNAAMGIANSGFARAYYQPIGDYLKPKKTDLWQQRNRNAALMNSGIRYFANSSSPSRDANIQNILYNSVIADGRYGIDAQKYDDIQEFQRAGFNRGTNQFNAEGYNKASLANAEMANKDRQYRANLAAGIAAQKMDADASWYNSLYGNLNSIYKGLSELGRENAQYNWIDRLAEKNALPIGSAYILSGEKACGGKIKRKKGKRGLTI